MKLLAHYLNTASAKYHKIVNWRENNLNDSLFYSLRETHYTLKTYPTGLHYHDYYELVVIEKGDIEYIREGQVFRPETGDIVLIPPRRLHMSSLLQNETLYRRHVFYLYPDAFDAVSMQALTGFLSKCESSDALLCLSVRDKPSLFQLLSRLDAALSSPGDALERALSLSLVIQIFYILNRAKPVSEEKTAHFPKCLSEIRRYIDENFTEIRSVGEISEHFYYSREYISRLFRRYFKTTVSDYITQRRIAKSQALISDGRALSEACYQSGFGSMSAFIRAFRDIAQMTPSQYRALTRKDT